jgi:ubiquinone/menaquinone biosynthesis C-methylase UbiE
MTDHSGKSRERQQLENKWLPVLSDSPSTEQFQQAYDEQYALFMEEGICRHVVKEELGKLQQSLIQGIDGGKRVLEIGFGNGVMSFQIARSGNKTVGIDVSKIFLDLAKSKLHGETGLDLRFEFGDARSLKFDDNSFDYVISSNLIEHLSANDTRTHMLEVRRILTERGCYRCFAPSRIYAGYRSAGFHLYMYSLQEIVELFSSCGFKVNWIEPNLRRFGIRKEIPRSLLLPVFCYERILSLLKSLFPGLSLEIGGYRLTPTVMIAAYKVS